MVDRRGSGPVRGPCLCLPLPHAPHTLLRQPLLLAEPGLVPPAVGIPLRHLLGFQAHAVHHLLQWFAQHVVLVLNVAAPASRGGG